MQTTDKLTDRQTDRDRHKDRHKKEKGGTLQTCFCTGSLRVVHTELGRLKQTLVMKVISVIVMMMMMMMLMMLMVMMMMTTSCVIGS